MQAICRVRASAWIELRSVFQRNHHGPSPKAAIERSYPAASTGAHRGRALRDKFGIFDQATHPSRGYVRFSR